MKTDPPKNRREKRARRKRAQTEVTRNLAQLRKKALRMAKAGGVIEGHRAHLTIIDDVLKPEGDSNEQG